MVLFKPERNVDEVISFLLGFKNGMTGTGVFEHFSDGALLFESVIVFHGLRDRNTFISSANDDEGR